MPRSHQSTKYHFCAIVQPDTGKDQIMPPTYYENYFELKTSLIKGSWGFPEVHTALFWEPLLQKIGKEAEF